MHRDNHIRKEIKKNFVINVVINAAIAYATLGGLDEIDAWGDHGFGKDLILTAFLLSAILSGVFIATHRRKRRSGEISVTGTEGKSLAWLLPFSPWLSAPWIGLLATAVSVPPVLGVLAVLNIDTLTPPTYIVIKALWAGVLAAVIVQVAILQGLRSHDGTSPKA